MGEDLAVLTANSREHIYRRHSLKSFCPRCSERFVDPEALKSHQRADVPCKIRVPVSDGTITEEQEKLLRARAKARCSEETKWEEMYHIIFPGEKVPSPCMTGPLPLYSTFPTNNTSDFEFDNPRLQSTDEDKARLHAEVQRSIRPAIEECFASLFEEVQKKVGSDTAKILRDVGAQVLKTFHFQEEQSSSSALTVRSIDQGFSAFAGAEPCQLLTFGSEVPQIWALTEWMGDDVLASDECIDSAIFGGGWWSSYPEGGEKLDLD